MAVQKFIQNDNNLAIAYYRFSSDSQSDASIDQQRLEAHRFAEQHGYTICREYEDYARTGTDTDRPGYMQMFREIERVKPSVLILWKIDRLNRNAADFLVARRRLMDAGIKLKFVADANIENRETELMVLAMRAAEAENYSANMSENISRGQRDIAEKCLYAGYKILGYRAEPAPEHGKHRKRYAIDPATAPIVQRIYREYADGVPMAEICKALNGEGLRTSTGGPFNINGMRKILTNPAYIGVYRYKGAEKPGGIPAIIDEELYKKAQSRLAQNKRDGSRRANELKHEAIGDAPAPRYWLTGKLFCGHCGDTMQGVSGTSKTRATKHYYYYCKSQRRKLCRKKPIKKAVLEGAVIHLFYTFVQDENIFSALAADITAKLRREREQDSGKLEMLLAAKKDVDRKLNNLVNALMNGIFSETTQAALQELEARKKALSDEIELEERMQTVSDDEAGALRLLETYRYADFDDPVIRDYFLENYVEAIYVYDDKIVTTFFYGSDKRSLAWSIVNEAVETDAAGGSTASSRRPPKTGAKRRLRLSKKPCRAFPTGGNVREIFLNFAKFRKISLLFCSAHGP